MPDKEKTGKAWLNVVVTVSAAGMITGLEVPKAYTALLPTRSVNQPTMIVVNVPTSPVKKYRKEIAPTEICSSLLRNTGRKGLSIVDANPVTAMFNIRNQKWRPLGKLEESFRIMVNDWLRHWACNHS